jgi:hypothetical protein
MSDIRGVSPKPSNPRRTLDLAIRPSDEDLFELSRKLLLGKLRGSEAIVAEELLARYRAEGDTE